MDWAAIERRLEPRYEELTRRATDSYPASHPCRERGGGVNQRFCYGVSFAYDRRSQEHEDLVFWLHCALSPTEFHNPDGSRVFPDAWDRDAIGFEIVRGTGHVLAELEPELLPADRDSPEYEQAVLDYLPRTEAFLDDHVAMILGILRTPFYS